jgi:hypothetical protein
MPWRRQGTLVFIEHQQYRINVVTGVLQQLRNRVVRHR